MKKKMILAFLGLSLPGLLAACGIGSGDGGQGSTAQSSVFEAIPSEESSNASTDSAAGADSSESADFSAASDTAAVPLHVLVTSRDMTRWNKESYDTELIFSDFTLALDEADAAFYPELAAALEEQTKTAESGEAAAIEELSGEYADLMNYASSSDFPNGISHEKTGTVLRADSNVVSVRADESWYLGGAHGSRQISGLNYDSQSGKSLVLSDVLDDEDTFRSLLISNFREQNADILDGIFVDLDSYLQGLSFSDSALAWTIDNEGITLYFQPEELGAYAIGSPSVRVFFAAAEGSIQDKYSKTAPSGYAVSLDENVEANLNGDGVPETFSLITTNNDEDSLSVSLCVDDQLLKIDDYAFSAEAELVVCGDSSGYAYVFTHHENDYTQLYIVDLASLTCDREHALDLSPASRFVTSWTEEGDSWSSKTQLSFTDPLRFELGERTDLLGTQSIYRSFHVGAGGVPSSDDTWYLASAPYVLQAKKEITCPLSDEAGNETGTAVIPKGTFLRMVRTDGDSICDLQEIDRSSLTKEGSDDWSYYTTKLPASPDYQKDLYRIRLDTGTYPHTIDGAEEGEVLDGIQYAG